MRKGFSVFGIILLFVGILVFLSCNSPTERTIVSQVVPPKKQWNVTAYFNQYEKIIVNLGVPPEFHPDGVCNVTVTIVDPRGGKSVFLATYRINWGYIKYTLISTDNGLDVDEPLPSISGVCNYSGNYTAQVDERFSYLYNGPPQISLSKEVVEKEYPYRSIWPAGIAIIIVGASLSIWAAKSSKPAQRLRRKRR